MKLLMVILDLYLKRISKKILFLNFCILLEKWKANWINFWTFVWIFYTWNKCNLGNAIFFLVLIEFKNFNIGKLHPIHKKLSEQNGLANEKLAFINPIAASLFLLQLSFACKLTFHFNMGKKLWRHASFSSTFFC